MQSLFELLHIVAYKVVAFVSKGRKPSLSTLKMEVLNSSENFITI